MEMLKSVAGTKAVLIIISVFIAVASLAMASDTPSVYNFGHFQDGSTLYLFGDRVNMRAKPDTKSPVVKMLTVGSRLTVVGEPAGSFKTGGFTSDWYKVKYEEQQETLEGYVWGGLLALGAVHFNDNGEEFLLMAGITKFSGHDVLGELRVVKNGLVKAKKPFRWMATDMNEDWNYSYTIAFVELPWAGNSALKNMFQLSCNYDACAFENGKLLFFWDGERLINGPILQEVSDAGLFSTTADFVFPGQEGCGSDELIIRTISIDRGDEEENRPATATKTEVMHVWNGKNWFGKAPVETPLPSPSSSD